MEASFKHTTYRAGLLFGLTERLSVWTMVIDRLKLNIASEDIGTELAEVVRGSHYP